MCNFKQVHFGQRVFLAAQDSTVIYQLAVDLRGTSFLVFRQFNTFNVYEMAELVLNSPIILGVILTCLSLGCHRLPMITAECSVFNQRLLVFKELLISQLIESNRTLNGCFILRWST